MKKIKFYLIFSIMSFMMIQLSQAQLLGKWVVPASVGSDKVICELIFTDNSPITYNPLSNPPPTFDVPVVFSAGGYDGNYETDFYFLGNRLYSNSDDPPTEWVGTTYPLYHNFQVVNKPMILNEYFAFLSKSIHHEASWLCWISVVYNESTGVATASELNEFHDFDFNRAAFTIVEEANTGKYIYAASVGEDDVTYNASFRRWKIIETGVTEETTIIDESDDDLSEMDFDAYNLEHIRNANNKDMFAWSHVSTDAPVDEIVILNDGNPFIIDLNLGRIGGIEFSSYEDNMLYVSCTDYGIVKVNYTNGIITEYVISNDFERTYLQTAPDGHIYGVSNNGSHLGRIDMNNGSFNPQVFTFPNGTSVATYNEFFVGNEYLKYYILPENERVHNPMSVTVETTNETCPGYADGTATIYVTGGTPCSYPDQEYTIVCNGGDVTEDYYDEDDHYFFFSGLTAGTYYYTITDCMEGTTDGEFTILSTEFTHNTMLTVTSTETWNGKNESFGEGLRILPGVTLTINNSILEFDENAKMIIEPGARVYVNNSLLTKHYCEPLKKWQGIEVRGDRYDNQYVYFDHPLAQGKLVLDGSTIEHAIDAVLLAAKNEEGRVDVSKSGGIVIANNSYFINNQKSVYGLYYQNMHPVDPGYEMDNLSYFKYCTFEVNSAYINDDYAFYKHVDLAQVKGFDFKACTFSNTAIYNVSDYNCGIMAHDAGFSVEAECSSQTVPCPYYDESYFSGFYTAVWAGNDAGSPYTFRVSRTNFTDNAIGVKASMVNNASILFSDFNIGYNTNPHAFSECSERSISYGIDMLESIHFAIEENNFTTTQTAGEYIGVRVLNSNTDYDLIYNNTYNNLTEANRAEGDNRDEINDNHGLEYQCNINTNNEIDFIVANYLGDDAQIKTRMGDNTLASGNSFTDDVNVMHFINEGTQNINYYWCDLNDCEYQEPLYYNTEVFFQPIDVNISNSCPSHYGSGGIDIKMSDEQRAQKEQDFTNNLNNYNNVLALFESLEDGGNTTGEILDIQTAQPSDMWELRAQLLGHSPYLSEEVLKTAADKTDVLPEGVLFEILSANPDELRNSDLIDYLENKENPLPDYMISILQQMAGGITAKTVLKMEMGRYSNAKTKAAQDIVRSILNDTIYNADDLRNWLGNMQSYNADKQIISSWLYDGNTADAISLLNLLPALYELEDDELVAYNKYAQFVNFQVNLVNDGRNMLQLETDEIQFLVDIADTNRAAANILQYAYGYTYNDCPRAEGGNKSTLAALPGNDNANAIHIEAYPSPAGTWISFEYQLPLNEKEAYISISDVNGRIIEKVQLNTNCGQKVIDVRKLNNGIWFYSLHTAGQSKSGKFIIQH
jgi:hypothetical protein